MQFAMATLGCKVNQYESERIREVLLGRGYVEQRFGAPVDLALINTCTVTHRSDAHSRRLIRMAVGSARVIATGCQAVTDPDGLRGLIPALEVCAPGDLAAALGAPLPRCVQRFHGHARAFVKVQEGCNHGCAYCIVPRAKGLPISRPLSEILEEVTGLCRAGYREIVLTGINIGLYAGGITALVRTVLDATPVERIRVSSIEPWTIDDGLPGLLRSERVCPHLHLPLQSGSARILAAMGRPYDLDYYRDLVHGLTAAHPHLAIGTDIMVGFPGEDEASFEESYRCLEALPLAYLHVFAYSRRPGTRAALMPGQVDEEEKKRRVTRLRRLSDAKRAAFLASQQGRVLDVLVTATGEERFTGISENYLQVQEKGRAVRGEIVPVKINCPPVVAAGGAGHG